jgi:hypothetical protein
VVPVARAAAGHFNTNRLISPDRPTANELESALNRVVNPLFHDQTEFYKQFKDNALFRNFVRDLAKRLINKNPRDSP